MFSIMHVDQSGDDNPSLDVLPELFDELSRTDFPERSVAVINEDSGWCLAVYPDGRIVFQNLSENAAKHMIPVPKPKVVHLWRALATGDMDTVLKEPWIPGYR